MYNHHENTAENTSGTQSENVKESMLETSMMSDLDEKVVENILVPKGIILEIQPVVKENKVWFYMEKRN